MKVVNKIISTVCTLCLITSSESLSSEYGERYISNSASGKAEKLYVVGENLKFDENKGDVFDKQKEKDKCFSLLSKSGHKPGRYVSIQENVLGTDGYSVLMDQVKGLRALFREVKRLDDRSYIYYLSDNPPVILFNDHGTLRAIEATKKELGTNRERFLFKFQPKSNL